MSDSLRWCEADINQRGSHKPYQQVNCKVQGLDMGVARYHRHHGILTEQLAPAMLKSRKTPLFIVISYFLYDLLHICPHFVFLLALNVLRGSPFLEPTRNPPRFVPLPFLWLRSLPDFRNGTKPISSSVRPFFPSLGNKYSGICFR